MMNNTMKLWVEALRSGKYRQSQGSLSCEDGGNCCLGVAVRVLTPELDRSPIDILGADLSSYPIVKEQLNLSSCDGSFKSGELIGEFGTDKLMGSLIDLNDELGWSFNQIADFIEENHKLLSN
jgi:hypothetical protein